MTLIFPGVNKLSQMMDCIEVDRFGSKESKKKSLNKMMTHQKLFKEGKKRKPLIIFPEGMTSNGNQIMDFKHGAFIGEYSIRPIILRYRSITENTWLPSVNVC